MSRFKQIFLATTSLAVWSCFGQTPDAFRQDMSQEDLVRLLASSPREAAWAAETIAQQGRAEMVPNLAALIAAYRGEPIEEHGSMPPGAAAIEAVADALIRLQAELPADTVMHLYPQFPAQTIILLSRASNNTAPLLEIFQTTRSRDLWLASGNLLALHPPPEFVRSLLGGVVASFSFLVLLPSKRGGYGGSGGCSGDFMMTHDAAFADWPKARMYRLVISGNPQNVFAPGIHPVGFSFWETTDYRDPWTDSDCFPGKSRDWRAGLLAGLRGSSLADFPLKSETNETVLYSSSESFEEAVKSAIDKQSKAFADVVEIFVHSGALSIQDAADLHLKCRIQVVDDRPGPREELPRVEDRWCAAAPLRVAGEGLPE